MFDNLGTALVQALGFFAVFGFFVLEKIIFAFAKLFFHNKNKTYESF